MQDLCLWMINDTVSSFELYMVKCHSIKTAVMSVCRIMAKTHLEDLSFASLPPMSLGPCISGMHWATLSKTPSFAGKSLDSV